MPIVHLDDLPTTRNIILTAAGLRPSDTAGCAALAVIETANKQCIEVLDFDDAVQEYAERRIVMPDDYDGGTITAWFEWTGEAGAGTVIWGLQAVAYSDDDALDQVWGTVKEITDTFIAADDCHISSATAAITIGGSPAGNKPVQFRVTRHGGTKTEDARLIQVYISYTGK